MAKNFMHKRYSYIYLEQGIEKDVVLNGGGNGTLGTIGNLLGAKLTGESIFLVRYVNKQ